MIMMMTAMMGGRMCFCWTNLLLLSGNWSASNQADTDDDHNDVDDDNDNDDDDQCRPVSV